MKQQTSREMPNYGNWVSKRLIYLPGAASFICLVLAIRFPVIGIVAVLFLLIAIYFAYIRYLFSSRGRNIQDQVRELVLANLDWHGKGRILDIGCGSGALTIGFAKKYSETQVVGIDYWGNQWEYSQAVCEKNAELEGVAERVQFQRASASLLPFEDDSFDAAISNLVFHEVSSVKDKKELLQEALRVVKKGGVFAFQDLFLWKQVYGDIDELVTTLQGWGIQKVKFIDTSKSAFIPAVLKLPFMVGTIGMIVGEK